MVGGGGASAAGFDQQTTAGELAMVTVSANRKEGREARPIAFCPFLVSIADLGVLQPRRAACPRSSAAPITLTIGLPVQTGANPLHGATQAARLISREGFTLPNRDGRAQPRLAESWIKSPDGLEWRFRLRTNAFFTTAHPLISAVKASLERSIKSSDLDQYPGLSDIVGIEARPKMSWLSV